MATKKSEGKKNLDAMSLEELDLYKRGLKAAQMKLKEEKKAAAIVYQGKISDWHVQQATDEVKKAAERDGRTPEEQAEFWLSQQYGDPGKHIMARRFLEQRLVNVGDL